METEPEFWIMEGRIFEYLKFKQFEWIEIILVAGVFSVLLGYFLFALYLDRRTKARLLWRKQEERLHRWLADWRLSQGELERLRELAGGESEEALYALLSNPVKFEGAISRAAGQGRYHGFTERLRQALRYHSGNLRVPVVSTRQMQPGDYFRLEVGSGARSESIYGQMLANNAQGFIVELTHDDFDKVEMAGNPALFYLRGHDVEYRFPCQITARDSKRGVLTIAHAMTKGRQGPRKARLPILRPFNFKVEQPQLDANGGPGDFAPMEALRGVLVEISEGGFSCIQKSEIADGSLIHLTLKRANGEGLPVTGRVLASQTYGKSGWLLRCEIKGLPPSKRSALNNLLWSEQSRRFHRLREARRKQATL